MINKQMVLDYLSVNYLSRYGILYNFEDFEDFKIFRFCDKETDEEPLFDEDMLVDTIETSLIFTSIKENEPALNIGALENSDIVLYYKGDSFCDIARNLVEHPHIKDLLRGKSGIQLTKEAYGKLGDFYDLLNFKTLLENIEYYWLLGKGCDPYERPEFGDQFYNTR